MCACDVYFKNKFSKMHRLNHNLIFLGKGNLNRRIRIESVKGLGSTQVNVLIRVWPYRIRSWFFPTRLFLDFNQSKG